MEAVIALLKEAMERGIAVTGKGRKGRWSALEAICLTYIASLKNPPD